MVTATECTTLRIREEHRSWCESHCFTTTLKIQCLCQNTRWRQRSPSDLIEEVYRGQLLDGSCPYSDTMRISCNQVLCRARLRSEQGAQEINVDTKTPPATLPLIRRIPTSKRRHFALMQFVLHEPRRSFLPTKCSLITVAAYSINLGSTASCTEISSPNLVSNAKL